MFDKDAIKQLAQAEAINAAALAIGPEFRATVALPDEFKIHDLEKHLPLRIRARGTMVTSVVPDFAAYARAHQGEGASVFIDQDKMSATAVLNLGTPAQPGHADNRARLESKRTAAYEAMRAAANGSALTQQKAAEFLEDWQDLLDCRRGDDAMTTPRAIAAVRKITIEALNRLESTAQNLSGTRSTFEQVQASSGAEALPTEIVFHCVPFHGMENRAFALRLAIHNGGKDPAVSLRVRNMEAHAEEMAAELAELVREAIDDSMPVIVGTYTAGA